MGHGVCKGVQLFVARFQLGGALAQRLYQPGVVQGDGGRRGQRLYQHAIILVKLLFSGDLVAVQFVHHLQHAADRVSRPQWHGQQRGRAQARLLVNPWEKARIIRRVVYDGALPVLCHPSSDSLPPGQTQIGQRTLLALAESALADQAVRLLLIS